MDVNQSIAALTAALVHPAAMDAGVTRARHQTFVSRTLILVFAALAGAPFFLAFHGAPTPAQTLLFSLCLAPLGAVTLVSRSGNLVLGHLVCVLCLVATAITLAVSREAGLAGALAWLVVAQTESLLSFNRPAVIATALVTTLVFACLATASVAGLLGTDHAASRSDLLIGLALGYATLNTLIMTELRAGLRKTDDASDRRTAAIAGAIDDLVVAFDCNGTVDFIGRACDRHLNLPALELMGRGFFEHIHVADRPIFLKAIADAAHGGERITTTFRLRNLSPAPRQDGGFDPTFLWIEMRAHRIEKAPAEAKIRRRFAGLTRARAKRKTVAWGEPAAGVMSLLRDVSATRQTIADLDAARRTAESASDTRNHFLANMSHELRTPLNAIIGFSEILGSADLRPAQADKQTEYARIIHQSGHHLLAVVNSMLDMAKIQSGTFSIDPESFDVGPLVESCCEIVSLKASEGRIELIRALAPGLEPVVGDRRACKQILINLLSNAIKFTPENGRVTVSARPEGNSLLIGVSDTGIGIAAGDLSRLGDPFFQVQSALNRPYEGTGLGLSVVRGLVGLHGGTIAIESEPGQGTSVTIRLPLDCRFAALATPSAKIETIARRRAKDRSALSAHEPMVKKSA